MPMKMKMKWGEQRVVAIAYAVFLIGTVACTSSKPASPAPVPAVAKPALPKDEKGTELTEPEIVRSKQVQIDNRDRKTLTVGNVNGDYVLACNMKAANCLTPIPGKDYYLFNKNTKWKMPGATTSITLAWVQEWTVSYPNAENVALVPSDGGPPEELGMYWLDSWSAEPKAH